MTAAAPRHHARLPPRRSAPRARSWWGKAWARAVEESAYAQEDLLAGRKLARAGRVGQITVDVGGYHAAVEDDHGMWTVAGVLPVLDPGAREALVETVAAEAGRIAALLAGDLPHTLVEHAEEAGVELLPYGGELGSACTCEAWTDPCRHALAVLQQLAWLVDDDPFVLLHLRGLPREELLARLHERAEATPAPRPGVDPGVGPEEIDVESGLEAALRAARVLAALEEGHPVDHLF
ncbi:SWIM zinc finger family protein [Nocardioides dongkuii]|uniref:SWIM zinc finger family protein n=1 Tax=Nocardioides dongkuii TaxID=2760089 RepID=UPI0015F85F5C|nr:SWIM zinc finger family protein [Nocardioides dongkuii]